MKYHPGNTHEMYPGNAQRRCASFEAPAGSNIPLWTVPLSATGYSPSMVIDGADIRYNTAESSRMYGSLWVVGDGENPASAGTRITNRVRLDQNVRDLQAFTLETNDDGWYPQLEAGDQLYFKVEAETSVSGSSSGSGDGPWEDGTPSALANVCIGWFARENLLG